MQIPNADRAYIDMQKLTAYSLNIEHPYGGQKARVFRSALGLTVDHAEMLRDALLQAIKTQDANPGLLDEYGQRYVVDFEMVGVNGRTAMLRSAWNIRPDEDFPRLVSVYVI